LKFKMLMVYLARYPLYPGFVSGGERHFIEVCKRTGDYEAQVEVLTCPTGQTVLDLNGIKTKTYQVSTPLENMLGKWHNVGLSLIYLMRIIRAIPLLFSLPRDYDIICATSHFLPEVLPAVIIRKRIPKAKLVIYLHHLEAEPWKARGRPLLGRIPAWMNAIVSLWLIKRHAHLVVTVTPAVREDLIARGIPGTKIRVFPNGIDMASIESAVPAEERHEACYFGRVAPTKGIGDIIDIWDDVCRSHPQARVAIIGGNGEGYLSRLRERIKAKNLETNVLPLGVAPEQRKYELIKACQVGISPSYEEGWGIAVCEVLACGLPVVAYDLPAYAVFGNEAMIKVPIGDKKALFEAVLTLLSDESLRRQMGQKALEVARQFSWQEVAEGELTLLSNLALEARDVKLKKRALICLLGVDGTGKTTAATKLCRRLEKDGFNCTYLSLNYSLFKFIPTRLHRTMGRPLVPIVEAKTGKSSPGSETSQVKRTTMFLLCLALLLRLADSLIGYFARVRPAARRSIVVHDRYFYDYVILYLDACPRWLLWCYRRLIPEPDLTFFLDVAPEIAQARDGEYSPSFYPLQRRRYLDFAKELKPGTLTIYNTDKPEEDVVSFLYNRVLEVIKGGTESA
jgi:glycosyltransferase involved in cell wall biosynthesis/thymidylate kinase